MKYQSQASDHESVPDKIAMQTTSFSPLALNRWLQVALPLTALTFAAAVIWLRREDRKLERTNMALPMAEPK